MPRTKLLVSALSLALCGVTSAQAQSFSGVVSFGDSLTDAGNVALVDGNPFTPPGSSFTTNNDPVYAQIVANAFGYSGLNSLSGGTNFAFGGACVRANSVSFTCGLSPGSFSLTSQLGGYLTATGGVADPNALYTMWGGANDIFTYAGLASGGFITAAQAQAFTGLSAQTMVGLVGTLQGAGAKTIVVFNLPDLGTTPLATASGPAAAAAFSGLSFVYNQTLNGGVALLGDGIVAINVNGLVSEVLANPGAYGFTNTSGTACGTLSGSLACGPAGDPTFFYHWAAGTDQTFFFADGVHPTGGAHALLARVVLATLSAPGQVSMAGELPLQVYDRHSSVINNQIFGLSSVARSDGDALVYGHLQYSRQTFDAQANVNSMDNDVFTGTFGADIRYSDNFSFGAALSFGGSNADTVGASIDGKEVLGSAYGVAHFGGGFIDAIVTGGSSNLDIDRSIVLGPTTRVETGSTNARHLAAELGGGFNFGSDDFHHGPFISLTWQKIDFQGYAEDSLDSTSMYFSDFTRKSEVGRIGYQAQATAGSFRPFGRVAYAKENKDDVTRVQAGSNTLNGHFTLDGFQPSQDWWEAALGVDWAMNDKTSFSLSYEAHLSDDAQENKSINLGFRMEFGAAAPAPAPEAEPMPAAKTCADLDDDSDGVTNCDDKCPGSPAGEAVGPDGCPVPAAAPEPVMEPKPFKG
jgi:outer membrane lipase/esterase